jgi:23S rRNA pseudouridine2605 synthase
MLFTNDGNFANFCMHPSSKIDREYLVRARGIFTNEKRRKLLNGVIIDGVKHVFSDIVEGQKNTTNQWFSVCLTSGKNREVRKLFQSIDMEVSRLKRTRFGPIFLPSTLRKGDCKELGDQEINSLKDYGTYSGT